MAFLHHIHDLSPDRGLDRDHAIELGNVPSREVFDLFSVTRKLRQQASGNKVYLCSIINAKSGRCQEDCGFCAQSSRYKTGIETYPLVSVEKITTVAGEALKNRAGEFSIVTSGKGIGNEEEVGIIEQAVSSVRDLGMEPCVSPGIVGAEVLDRWKRAGLSRYHHNLETAPGFFKNVCTTHEIEEDIAAVAAAKASGLKVCCGGLFGMGESWAHRVELAFLLRELEVDSVPINFLNPIAGTPIAETAPGITPLEALKTITLFRLVMPRARIVLCGGRERNLRDLQAFMFEAGANAILIGNYLTTVGRPPEEDLRLIEDLGLEAALP